VGETLKMVFEQEAPKLARKHGLRERLFSSTALASVLVLGWLQNPAAGSCALARFAGSFGLRVQKQHIEAHFTPRTAAWLLELLQYAVSLVVTASQQVSIPLLWRFSAVWIEDSSTISLPAALAHVWQGCGGNSKQSQAPLTEASLKLGVRWNLRAGQLQGPYLHSARTHDRHTDLAEQPMEPGSLWIADLGYFALYWLAHLSAQGVFFLIRLKDPISIWINGQRRELLDCLPQAGQAPLDTRVRLGAKQELEVRLLAWRVPDEVVAQRQARIRESARTRQKPVQARTLALARWSIVVTSVPAQLLSLSEAQALLRARWQMELLFKLWKDQCLLDEWRTKNPHRILCEIYAKLLAVLVQHWLTILACWDDPHRSLFAVASQIREQVSTLVHGFTGRLSLRKALGLIGESIQGNCSIPARAKRPSASRLLLGAPVWGLT
jgi:hypothetical protein